MVPSLSNLIQKVRNITNIIDLQGRSSLEKALCSCCILTVESQEEKKQIQRAFLLRVKWIFFVLNFSKDLLKYLKD